ncbi:hypothetical protein A2U01_0084975, partial [Trifolium medium]|nr:hypothetical protein [Trifolium medium]
MTQTSQQVVTKSGSTWK